MVMMSIKISHLCTALGNCVVSVSVFDCASLLFLHTARLHFHFHFHLMLFYVFATTIVLSQVTWGIHSFVHSSVVVNRFIWLFLSIFVSAFLYVHFHFSP